jgi:hypothetical protein
MIVESWWYQCITIKSSMLKPTCIRFSTDLFVLSRHGNVRQHKLLGIQIEPTSTTLYSKSPLLLRGSDRGLIQHQRPYSHQCISHYPNIHPVFDQSQIRSGGPWLKETRSVKRKRSAIPSRLLVSIFHSGLLSRNSYPAGSQPRDRTGFPV